MDMGSALERLDGTSLGRICLDRPAQPAGRPPQPRRPAEPGRPDSEDSELGRPDSEASGSPNENKK